MRSFLRWLPERDILSIQPVRWLVLTRLCTNLFFYSTTIVLFQQQRGLNFTEMFLMESILSGSIWLADVPTSIWADRFGYRRMILLGCLCNLAGMVCFLFAYGFWMFAIANVLGGFAIACSSGCESALLYRQLTPAMREKQGNDAFRLLTLASTCGFFLGMGSGSFLGALSPTLAVGISIFPLLGALAAAWRIKESPIAQDAEIQQARTSIVQTVKIAGETIRRRPMLIGLRVFSSAAFLLTNAIFWYNQPFFTRANIPIELFGPIMAAALGLQFLALLALPALLRRLSARTILILSCLLPGLAYLSLTWTAQPLFTCALIACVVAFPAWQEPLVSNQLNRQIDDKARATTLSALSLVGSLVGIVLNPWIGSLGDRSLSATGLGLGTALIALCALIPVVIRERR